MCVIIHRSPGITIPFEKLKSACLVNADGMGLVAYDRGKLELRKFFEAKGNNPETLQKFLEDAKDLHVYAHLRYRTKGTTDKENVHPFGVLTKKKHDMDVQFMHNGTLSDFGTDKSCDSKEFAKKLLRPLSERLLKAVDPKELLHDDVFVTILNKYAGGGSVFLLADSFGSHRIINYDKGKEFEGWWASNEYSFNRFHRDPPKKETTSYYNNTHYNRNWDSDEYWDNKEKTFTKKNSPQTNNKKIITLPPLPPTTATGATGKPPFNDEVPFNTDEGKATPKINPTLGKRQLFIEVAEIKDLTEVCSLSYDEICDLVDDFPEQAAMLIRDLIKVLYDVEVAEDSIDEDEDEKEVA